MAEIPMLVITGPVGVGKTTVAIAISQLLSDAGSPHAMIDMDHLRWCSPSPEEDPFHVRLGLRNLAAVAGSYREAGAKRLVLADIVETRADVAGYQEAVPGASVVVVRLHASLPTILSRLVGREGGDTLQWHQGRAAELIDQMERDRVEDLLIQTEGRTADEIAREALAGCGWSG